MSKISLENKNNNIYLIKLDYFLTTPAGYNKVLLSIKTYSNQLILNKDAVKLVISTIISDKEDKPEVNIR